MAQLHRVEQRSDKWFLLRRGVITGSDAGRLLTPAKRKTYGYELLAELMSDVREPDYRSPAMQWGVDHEPNALARYEIEYGSRPDTSVGFAISDVSIRFGFSPDGLIGDDGLIETKCPTTKTHLEYMITEDLPADYVSQIQWGLFVLDRAWCDFVSYDPRVPDQDLWVKRYERDDEHIAKLRDGAEKVAEFLNKSLRKLRGK